MLQDYHLVKHRRNGSTIYRCNHHTHYMKVGPKEEIGKEIQLYQKLKAIGIPLPQLLSYELHEDDLSRMKEETIPGQLYADLFTTSYDKTQSISDDLIEQFIVYQHKHLDGQLKTIGNTDIVEKTFPKFSDLYKEGEIAHDIIDKAIEQILEDTKIEAYGWNHGDHNAYNIFTDGVIDLEDSFYGPVGYDTITAITQYFWFPAPNTQPGELTRQHAFSQEQTMYYLQSLSTHKIGLDFINSGQFGALFLMRGIFVTVGSDTTPLLKAYRYKKLYNAIHAYLNKENMLDFYFKNF